VFGFEAKHEGKIAELQVKINQKCFFAGQFGDASGHVGCRYTFASAAFGAEKSDQFAGFYFCFQHYSFHERSGFAYPLGKRRHDAQCDKRIEAQQHVEVYLVDFENRALCFGFDRGVTRSALDQSHFSEKIAFIGAVNIDDRLVVFFMNLDSAFFKKIKGIAIVAFLEQNCSSRDSAFFDNF